MKFIRLANKVTGSLSRNYKIVDHMKMILNFAITFKKAYKEKFDVISIVNIVNNKIVLDFLTGMHAQSYYRYKQVSKIMLRDESVFPLLSNLNADDDRLKSLGISDLH